MRVNREEQQRFKDVFLAWVAGSAGSDARIGIDDEQAARRAQDLLEGILDRRLSPEAVELTQEVKLVLSVLVSQLSQSKREPDDLVRQADAVYQFIRRLSWGEDRFDEKQDLLFECAEIGWRAVGLSVTLLDLKQPIPAVTGAGSLAETALDGARTRTDLARESSCHETREAATTTTWDQLTQLCDSMPAVAADLAATLYLSRERSSVRITTSRDESIRLGNLAAVAGRANRLLGRRAEAELWLGRAEAAFLKTAASGPMMANLAYEWLGVQFDMGCYGRVLEVLPSVSQRFETLGMGKEVLKCQVVHAMALKAISRFQEAAALFQTLRDDTSVGAHPALLGHTLVNLADLWSAEGEHEQALTLCAEALPLLKISKKPFVIAHMKGVVGDCLWHQGKSTAAISAHREAVEDYEALGMASWVAYHRVVLAERLMMMNRHLEAEGEILAALPTIEAQHMAPEGLAALTLLKQSLRRRKTDPSLLRELREHLGKGK